MQLGGCAWGSQKASNQPDQVGRPASHLDYAIIYYSKDVIKISHKEFKKPCKPNYPFNLMAAIL